MTLAISWVDDAGQVQILDVDCSVSESYEAPAEVAEHAVERGANVSDHVRPGGQTITLQAVVSNTPTETRTFGADGATMEWQSTSTAGGSARTLAASQDFDRVRAVDEQLLALHGAGTVLAVSTSLRQTVEDCVIQRYAPTRDAETGNVLAFTLELRKVRIASSQTVQTADPQQRRGQPARNRGAQAARQTTGDRRSLLARLADAIPGSLR